MGRGKGGRGWNGVKKVPPRRCRERYNGVSFLRSYFWTLVKGEDNKQTQCMQVSGAQTDNLKFNTFQFDLQSSSIENSRQPEAYGVIIAPGLGECRWQSLCTNRRERQPVLLGLHPVDYWTLAQWSFRPQYVLSGINVLPRANLYNRSVYRQHTSDWNTCFVSHCVRRTLSLSYYIF